MVSARLLQAVILRLEAAPLDGRTEPDPMVEIGLNIIGVAVLTLLAGVPLGVRVPMKAGVLRVTTGRRTGGWYVSYLL